MWGSHTSIILQHQILVAYLILFADLLDFDQICPLKRQFVGVELISFQRYSYLDVIYVYITIIVHQLNMNDSMVYWPSKYSGMIWLQKFWRLWLECSLCTAPTSCNSIRFLKFHVIHNSVPDSGVQFPNFDILHILSQPGLGRLMHISYRHRHHHTELLTSEFWKPKYGYSGCAKIYLHI